MENSNKVDDPNKKLRPKPTDDPGAKIETVTPDSRKESLLKNQCNHEANAKSEYLTEFDANGNLLSKSQENNINSEYAEIEIVSQDIEIEILSDDRQSASEDIIDSHETDMEDNCNLS